MRELSTKAKLYIIGTILTGLGIFVWYMRFLDYKSPWVLIIFAILGVITQSTSCLGATYATSFMPSYVVFGFAILYFDVPGALFVIMVSHIGEWIIKKDRLPYYIQIFNIASYTIPTLAVGLLYKLFHSSGLLSPALDVFGLMVAMAVFTFLNHVIVGMVVNLARGQNFSESGALSGLSLGIDFTLMCLGGSSAILWESSPYMALLPLIPLYLIYKALKLPALERQTQLDAKTGLINHKYFMEAFERELARANRFDRPLTIVMADLDLLRNVNNNYGHIAGDEVIVRLAQILKESFRWHDVVARFGGEEYCALLPDSSPQDVFDRVDAIRRTIAETDFEVSTSVAPLKVTMSFGVAGRDEQAQTSKEIIHNADLALYQAKETGRNRACLYTSDGVQNVFTMAKADEKPRQASPENRKSGDEVALEHKERAIEILREASPDAIPMEGSAYRSFPQQWVNAYIAAVGAAALALMAIFIRPTPNLDWFGLALFTLVVFITEWFAIEVYNKDTTVSTSAAAYIAGILIFGPIGAAFLGIAVGISALSHHRKPIKRLIFNICNHMVAGLFCAGLFQSLRLFLLSQPLVVQLACSVAAALVVYLQTTFLIAIAIHLDSGQPIKLIWGERFRWLGAFYAAFGVVAFLFILSYQNAGLLGVIAVLAPIFMLRLSQVLFIERTKTMVNELKKTNAQLEQRAQENAALNEELLLVLARVSEMRDPYVMGHSQHVARYAVLLAKELGLPDRKMEQIRKAALLHDIGKLGISDAIIFKPGALSKEEYRIVQMHPKIGADLLNVCHSLRELMPFILHHHERYDGHGYPDGLRGEEIPLEARILALADAVEAMASDRHYRPAHDIPSVLKEIELEAGAQFDPEVVKAFERVVEREGDEVVINSARKIEAYNSSRAVKENPSIFSIADSIDVCQRLLHYP
jgi:diguanylate cyclase (GGDEF)-like protein/putative nucleotidyltransferase with HDIG domain